MNSKQLLNELEEVLRTTPPLATRRHDTPENHAWVGRAANVIEQWDSSRSPAFRELVKQFHAPMAREAGEAFQQIIVLLNQAQYDLHVRSRISTLEGYRRQLKGQDDVIRTSSGREIDLPVSSTLINLFSEISQAFPELNLRSFEGHGSPEVLRSQLSLAIGKISEHIDSGSKPEAPKSDKNAGPAHPELVFVIHGRQLIGEFHIFLRALGLKPLEWSEARRRTNKPNPYTWEIVDLALKEAGAIVALFTPDDEARLRENLWGPNENAVEKQYLCQPRQNVLFEAGVAYGRDPQRTILIRVGSHRPMSDLTGHHIVQLDDSPESRQAVADGLRLAGCPVDVSGSEWFRAGTFSIPDPSTGVSIQAERAKKDSGKLLLYKTQVKGLSDISTAANVVASIHSFFLVEPQYLNKTSTLFLEKYPLAFKDQLSYNPEVAMKKWSLDELKRDVESLNIE
jgi:predicted nucleotide-binding protein